MNFHYKLLGLLTATIVIFPQTHIAIAQETKGKLYNTAKNVTVYLTIPDPLNPDKPYLRGSGVIVGKQNSTYYVLTAWHVLCPTKKRDRTKAVCNQNDIKNKNFKVVTANGTYPIIPISVKQISGLDAAVLKFNSDVAQQFAKTPDHQQLNNNTTIVYTSAWKSSNGISLPKYQFKKGEFIGQFDRPVDGANFSYLYESDEDTHGISGSPIFDESGLLVAIHTGNNKFKPAVKIGVLIKSIFNETPKVGLTLTPSTIAQEETPTIQQPITFLPRSPVPSLEQKLPEVLPRTINTLNYGITPEYGNPASLKVLLETKQCVWCNLNTARLSGADLLGAVLAATRLSGADLRNTNFSAANLVYADLRKADLRGANLEGANLQGANLQRANLEGANLQDANLQGANLQGAIMPDGKVRY
ncbi:pentapeptide repeat-containing protein [Nostoc sp. UCD121]|uniref:pentapeptide repeat-containing protein n=1 Tax=unclassified Nostoc TaxID=2593658 RepID=UPI001627FD56|nr:MULTISPECIES: pentapeptide repeat-containing protein [unclassified Nostoc]MBC1222670.1 pentapeptide repeat-containing protein [Nostoc sp. UCD120]MBC1279582.1 pentapeptide repeat-containing protein [Nostoc sp. UCD121]